MREQPRVGLTNLEFIVDKRVAVSVIVGDEKVSRGMSEDPFLT